MADSRWLRSGCTRASCAPRRSTTSRNTQSGAQNPCRRCLLSRLDSGSLLVLAILGLQVRGRLAGSDHRVAPATPSCCVPSTCPAPLGRLTLLSPGIADPYAMLPSGNMAPPPRNMAVHHAVVARGWHTRAKRGPALRLTKRDNWPWKMRDAWPRGQRPRMRMSVARRRGSFLFCGDGLRPSSGDALR